MPKSNQESYDELSLYTLSHPDPAFIHQYIVDAYMAQNADEGAKPIALTFALIGLYLHIEKNYSGRAVQLAHMQMGKVKKEWPKFTLPEDRGDIFVNDVLEAPAGEERDVMINKWSSSVWTAWKASHAQIAKLATSELSL